MEYILTCLNNNLAKYKPREKTWEENGSTGVSGSAPNKSTTISSISI